MQVEVIIRQLENVPWLERKCIGTVSSTVHELPDDECKEARPDWGEYLPLTTFPAIERALRKRGLMPPIPSDQRYYLGIVK